MFENKKISIIIPTYNEEKSIAEVINDFFATGWVDEVVVVDNNAKGNTKAEILKTGARYVYEPRKQGYGYALMRGLQEAIGDLLITCEGDGTFRAIDLDKFLSYSRDFDVVFGTRTSRAAIWSGAFMPFPVRFGNWAVAKIVEVLHNGPVLTDVGCTYKLFSRRAYEKIKDLFKLSDGGGRFSPEVMIWAIRRKLKSIEIPVIFKPRVGQSMYTGSIIKAAILGFKMIPLIIKYRLKRI
ncbi:MAG: glycosyltransferase family 2 protein [Candidatus Buchananbacteria bacterium]|nr:glycosyltransferase family 2 protein [Candidatus Buchananbacteria bacterium]